MVQSPACTAAAKFVAWPKVPVQASAAGDSLNKHRSVALLLLGILDVVVLPGNFATEAAASWLQLAVGDGAGGKGLLAWLRVVDLLLLLLRSPSQGLPALLRDDTFKLNFGSCMQQQERHQRQCSRLCDT